MVSNRPKALRSGLSLIAADQRRTINGLSIQSQSSVGRTATTFHRVNRVLEPKGMYRASLICESEPLLDADSHSGLYGSRQRRAGLRQICDIAWLSAKVLKYTM
jgi:hypothetical protein